MTGRIALLLTVLGIALCVLGARINLIGKYCDNIPYWDAFAKECAWLETPFIEGKPWLDDFLRPHNEHRIYTSLALNGAITIAAGQWDGRAEAMIGALLFLGIVAGLYLWAERNFETRLARWSVQAVVCATALSPVGWENTINGFQSQFYLVIGLSLFALHASLFSRAFGVRWWLGQFAGAAAIMSMGSGFVWAVPVVGWSLWTIVSQRGAERWAPLPSAISAIIIIAAGIALSYSPPWHAALHAHSPQEFLLYLFHSLAWPTADFSWLSLLWISPALAFVLTFVMRHERRPREVFILCILGWLAIQLAGLSYSRGAGGGYPATRYADLFAMVSFAEIIALASLLETSLSARTKLRWLLPIWCAAFLVGLSFLSAISFKRELPRYQAATTATADNLREYLLTKNEAKFLHGNLPLPPSMESLLISTLNRPGMKEIMPESVRPPLPLSYSATDGVKENVSPEALTTANGRFGTHWGTFSKRDIGHSEVESDTIRTSGKSYWRMYLTGQINGGEKKSNAVEIQFRDEASGQIVRAIRFALPTSGEWRRIYVNVPTEPFRVVVPAQPPGAWVGWSDPVEVSTLSYWTEYIVRRGNVVIALGIVLWVAGIALKFFHRQQRIAEMNTQGVRI